MPVQTFLKDAERSDGTGSILAAAGACPMGSSVNFTQSELNEMLAEGRQFLNGPGISPGAPPVVANGTAVVEGAAGVLSAGAYKWVVTFVTALGETLASAEIGITLAASKKGSLSKIPIGPEGITARKIYRTIAGGATGTEKLSGTIADNTTTIYEDNIADGSLTTLIPASDTSSNAAAAAVAMREFQWHQGP